MTLTTACTNMVGAEKPEIWTTLSSMRRVTLDARNAEVDVVPRSVMERFAIKTLVLLRKVLVTAAAIGVSKRRTHPVGLVETPGYIQHRIFDGEKLDSRATEKADAAMAIDTAKARRVWSVGQWGGGMARGEVHGRSFVEIVTNFGVKRLAVWEVTRITEIVVGFEKVGRPPSRRADNEYETCDCKKPHGRSRGSA